MLHKETSYIMERDIIHGIIIDFHGTQSQDIWASLMMHRENIVI